MTKTFKDQRFLLFVAVICFLVGEQFSTSKKCALNNTEKAFTHDALKNARTSLALSEDKTRVPSKCPCIGEYLSKVKALGISNGVSFEEWESMLCQPPLPPTATSNKSFVLGLGPGTTATRSFALVLALLNRKVLHWKVVRDRHSNKTEWVGDDKYLLGALNQGMGDHTSWRRLKDVNYAQLFQNLDAVFDHPYPMYASDILRYFPNAKVIMTHRNATEWFYKRGKFCGPGFSGFSCAVPFLLRPVRTVIPEWRNWKHQH